MMAENRSSLCLTGRDPVPLTTVDVCNEGFYCPNNSAEYPPQYCPPTPECLTIRLQNEENICPEAQGIFEPVICKAGWYCPQGGKEAIVCPEGHYCPMGSSSPSKCMSLSSCPRGSEDETPFIGIVICAIVDVILLALWLWPGIRRRMIRKQRESSNNNRESSLEGQDGEKTGDERFEIASIFLDDAVSVGLDVEFRDVSLCNKKSGRRILSAINGTAKKGSLFGIMGPSGSGKTTLVNILAGKARATSGSLLLNGVEDNLSSSSNSNELIRFVPQDDIVHPHLTVWENITHSARIRLGGFLNDTAITRHVENVIQGLALSKVKDSIVGDHQQRGVSGGERKRVSIALELVAAPRVLILDEPTSGLDARAALSTVTLLKSLADKGITVICVIHQPRVEIFEALDTLLLLESGEQAYLGPAAKAQEYFEDRGYEFDTKLNPADTMLDIVSGTVQPNDISTEEQEQKTALVHCQRAETPTTSSSSCTDIRSDSNSSSGESESSHDSNDSKQTLIRLHKEHKKRTASWYRQVQFCFYRDVIQQSRQVTVFLTEIFAAVITGLLIGLAMYDMHGQLFQGLYLPPFEALSSAVNYKLVPQVSLLTCFAISFAAAAPSVTTFGEEALIFHRESHSGHSEIAYFLGKVLSSIIRCLLAALHYTTFYMLLARPFVSFGMLLALNFIYFYCLYGVGSIVAALTERKNGPLVSLLATIILAVLGGVDPLIATVKEWHLAWLWYLFPGIWFSEAFFNEHVSPMSYLFNTEAAATVTGYVTDRTGFDIGLMVAIGTAYRAIGCSLMVIRARTGWW